MAADGTIFTRTTPPPSVAVSTANPRRQKRMGPAPFASFEDLSDEFESPEDSTAASVVRLPGIHEDITPSTPGYSMSHSPEVIYTGISLVGQVKTPVNPSTSFADSIAVRASVSKLQAPSTPRIDISRASSSSHHDSKDSSPDREITEGKMESTRYQEITKLGVGFREDGTLDLRSSTEELAFHDQKELEKKKSRSRPQSPSYLHDDSYQNHTRKDSQCSEISLLAISGRTSRLSSIGSVGSNQSRISNASHLSVQSGGTDLSRSSSPHKMLLETSFCGTKSPQSMSSVTIDKIGTKDSDDFEAILLSRKHDPTEAILAEGICVKRETRSASMKEAPQKPARRIEKRVQSVRSDIKIKVDSPSSTDANITPRPTKKIIAESGVEYIYIPLKGPLPLDFEENETNTVQKVRKIPRVSSESSSKSSATKSNAPKARASSAKSKQTEVKIEETLPKPKGIINKTAAKTDEPKYIRIKLKPDHLYDDDDDTTTNTSRDTQPEKVDLDEIKTDDSTTGTYDTGKSLTSTPSVSPKFSRHCVVKDYNLESKTPSPSLSRKGSFASIFRSKEAITSPESPTVPGRRKSTITGILREASESLKDKGRRRSRSKSRERDRPLPVSNTVSSSESIDSRGKTKGLFSIFRTSKGDVRKPDIELDFLPEKMTKVEFNFSNGNKKPDKLIIEKPLEANSIRIPLHSPTHYESENHRLLRDIQTPSQESQDTVIEVIPPKKEEANPVQNIEITNKKTAELQSRQSSTSSENVVFTTSVGSNNEIFTTKLPKDKRKDFSLAKNERVPQPGTHVILETTLEIHQQQEQEEKEKELKSDKAVEAHKEPDIKRTISSTSLKQTLQTQISMISLVPKADKIQPERALPNNHLCDDEKNESSESEKDSEASSVLARIPKTKNEIEVTGLLEPEAKSLVVQESFEDELPYIPTTLPQERSAALPIVPIKQRNTFEMKTCPIDRPRSTTPINPNSLEEYCEDIITSNKKMIKSLEKLKISLPRLDSSENASKSPKKPVNTNWFEFAEKCSHSGRKSSGEADTPPPLPPKGIQKEWINFEEVPERRKLAKRIQTIPSRGQIDVPENVVHDHVMYNYVNPDECRCECHEKKEKNREAVVEMVQEDEIPLLLNELEDQKVVHASTDKIKSAERASLFSDSSVDLSISTEQNADSRPNGSLRKPFKTDFDVSSNRSSVVSMDEPHSPCSEKPNAFSKPS